MLVSLTARILFYFTRAFILPVIGSRTRRVCMCARARIFAGTVPGERSDSQRLT